MPKLFLKRWIKAKKAEPEPKAHGENLRLVGIIAWTRMVKRESSSLLQRYHDMMIEHALGQKCLI